MKRINDDVIIKITDELCKKYGSNWTGMVDGKITGSDLEQFVIQVYDKVIDAQLFADQADYNKDMAEKEATIAGLKEELSGRYEEQLSNLKKEVERLDNRLSTVDLAISQARAEERKRVAEEIDKYLVALRLRNPYIGGECSKYGIGWYEAIDKARTEISAKYKE